MSKKTSKLLSDAARFNKEHFSGKAKVSFNQDEDEVTIAFKLTNPKQRTKLGFQPDAVSSSSVEVDSVYGDWGSWV